MGLSSLEKGKRFECDVAATFRAAGFPNARRGLGQARGGAEAADVVGIPGYWIECKHGARPSVKPVDALRQAEGNANGEVPVAICKVNHEPATATLALADFITLLAKGTR